jgi:hypothetical protein
VFKVSVAEIDCIDLNRGNAVGTHAYRIDAGLYRLVCRNDSTVTDVEIAQLVPYDATHLRLTTLPVIPPAFPRSSETAFPLSS